MDGLAVGGPRRNPCVFSDVRDFADYRIDSPEVVPGPSGEVYTFHRSTVQSNLYRQSQFPGSPFSNARAWLQSKRTDDLGMRKLRPTAAEEQISLSHPCWRALLAFTQNC